MARQAIALLLLVLACAACATTGSRERGIASLRRFDAVCRFLPTGMSSYWFTESPADPSLPEDEQRTHRIARAAKDFVSPTSIPSMGKQTSLEVYDHGVVGDAGIDSLSDPSGLTRAAPIDGHPVWRTPPEDRGGERGWLTFVDGRYQLNASSRQLLVDALEANHTTHELLSFLPDLSVLDAQASDLIFCRPRPQPTTAFGGPSPTAPMIVQVDARALRIRFHCAERQPQIEDYYGRGRQTTKEPTVRRGPYFEWQLTFPAPDSWMLELILLYGQHLAI